MPSDPERPRDDGETHRRLADILHHIAKAETFMTGVGYEAFLVDDLRFYAVTRCLEIVSEASRRLPAELKARHTGIAWREMAAAGNIYRHEYDNVAAQRVWHTLAHSLQPLRDVVLLELARLDRQPDPIPQPDPIL